MKGKIVAMLVDDELVVKLPAERCAALVAAGSAQPFRTGKREMREWVSIPHEPSVDWAAIAEEARAFVREGTP